MRNNLALPLYVASRCKVEVVSPGVFPFWNYTSSFTLWTINSDEADV